MQNLVGLQEELQREFGRLAAVTVDEPYVNGAFRAGLGGAFPFLSDVDRKVAERARPARADGRDCIARFSRSRSCSTRASSSAEIWCGFWYWGNPTPDELRLALREIVALGAAELRPAGGLGGGRLGGSRRRDRRADRLDPGELRGSRALARRRTRARCRRSAPSSADPRSTAVPGSCAASRSRRVGPRST